MAAFTCQQAWRAASTVYDMGDVHLMPTTPQGSTEQASAWHVTPARAITSTEVTCGCLSLDLCQVGQVVVSRAAPLPGRETHLHAQAMEVSIAASHRGVAHAARPGILCCLLGTCTSHKSVCSANLSIGFLIHQPCQNTCMEAEPRACSGCLPRLWAQACLMMLHLLG